MARDLSPKEQLDQSLKLKHQRQDAERREAQDRLAAREANRQRLLGGGR